MNELKNKLDKTTSSISCSVSKEDFSFDEQGNLLVNELDRNVIETFKRSNADISHDNSIIENVNNDVNLLFQQQSTSSEKFVLGKEEEPIGCDVCTVIN